jgi:uncharacterized protein YegL
MGIPLPGEDVCPPGPHRDLLEALHQLYRQAGTPGIRAISQKSSKPGDLELRGTVSHEGVSAILHGVTVPRWSKLETLVRILADRAVGRPDVEATAKRFLDLWLSIQSETITPVELRAPTVRASITAENSQDFIEVEQGITGLPVYLVLDTSMSMVPHLRVLRESLVDLHYALLDNPLTAELVSLSIITFNAEMIQEMTDISEMVALRRFVADGSTHYGQVFDLVSERIDLDLPKLSSRGRICLRPIVFLVTYDEPADLNWEVAFARLVRKAGNGRPHVVAFGIGDVSRGTLARISTRGAYRADGALGHGVPGALRTVVGSLRRTVAEAAVSREFYMPTALHGFEGIQSLYG